MGFRQIEFRGSLSKEGYLALSRPITSLPSFTGMLGVLMEKCGAGRQSSVPKSMCTIIARSVAMGFVGVFSPKIF